MSKWQPIETAPKDESLKLGWGGLWQGEIHGISDMPAYSIFTTPADRTDYAGHDLGWWNADGGDAYATWVKPTHWMPLPEPPL